MFAVIKTGAKQYPVEVGKVLKIEKIDAKEGDKVTFEEVLLFDKGDNKPKVGNPLVKDVKVQAKVLKQGRNDKVLILKHKPKKRYKLKRTHRQPYTQVEILKIG
ncbi:MAG: 50S ribosomal protein L21 [Candidatus Moranbacteria bacterium]|nr:50S ribosomal protein L21 [Candidatus Moranbacteria bacterium]